MVLMSERGKQVHVFLPIRVLFSLLNVGLHMLLIFYCVTILYTCFDWIHLQVLSLSLPLPSSTLHFPSFVGGGGVHVRVYVCVLNYCVHLELLICVWGYHEVPPYFRKFGKIDNFWDSKNKFFVCLLACFLECGPWNPPHALVDSWYPDSFIAQHQAN